MNLTAPVEADITAPLADTITETVQWFVDRSLPISDALIGVLTAACGYDVADASDRTRVRNVVAQMVLAHCRARLIYSMTGAEFLTFMLAGTRDEYHARIAASAADTHRWDARRRDRAAEDRDEARRLARTLTLEDEL